MSDRASSPPTDRPFVERAIEAADRPLLVVALAAVSLYLLELRGILTASGPVRIVSFVFDALFIADVLLKAVVLRGRYLRSAWLVTDVLSCLPGVSLALNVSWLSAMQFTRLFRTLRMLRSLRIFRSLQAMPSLVRLAAERDEDGASFRRGMNISIGAYAMVFIGLLEWLRLDFTASGAMTDRAEFFLVMGSLVATALFLFVVHAQVHETSWNQLRGLLNIALPQQVAFHFLHHPEAYHERHRSPATTVFIDFVGFSSTAEKLRSDVQELAHHLERVMDVVVEQLVAQDLIIDKFIGDAVMAFRGGPLVQGEAADHARRVVRAALNAASALRELDDPYFSRVKIGGASDECLIGAFGTSKRLSYTALGDGVNLAARLEPASAQCGTQALFCDATRRLCGEIPGIAWRRWGTIRVKGKSEPQVVWEALDEARITDCAFIRAYESARAVFELEGPAAARPLFARVDQMRAGGDPPSRIHGAWCDELEKKPRSTFDTTLSVSK